MGLLKYLIIFCDIWIYQLSIKGVSGVLRCPEDWTLSPTGGAKCLYYSDTPLPQAQAQMHCENEGAYLVTVDSKAINEEITAKLVSDQAYLGLKVSPTWEDGTLADRTYWGDTSIKAETNCVFMNATEWKGDDCDNQHSFICKKGSTLAPQSWVCDPDWILGPSNQHCFKIFKGSSTATYIRAQRRCRALDASLLAIKSAEEYQFIVVVLRELSVSSHWLALSLFTWHDGTSYKYNNWDTGGIIVNNASPERCVVVSKTGTWTTVDCSAEHNYICAKDAEETDATTHNEQTDVEGITHNEQANDAENVSETTLRFKTTTSSTITERAHPMMDQTTDTVTDNFVLSNITETLLRLNTTLSSTTTDRADPVMDQTTDDDEDNSVLILTVGCICGTVGVLLIIVLFTVACQSRKRSQKKAHNLQKKTRPRTFTYNHMKNPNVSKIQMTPETRRHYIQGNQEGESSTDTVYSEIDPIRNKGQTVVNPLFSGHKPFGGHRGAGGIRSSAAKRTALQSLLENPMFNDPYASVAPRESNLKKSVSFISRYPNVDQQNRRLSRKHSSFHEPRVTVDADDELPSTLPTLHAPAQYVNLQVHSPESDTDGADKTVNDKIALFESKRTKAKSKVNTNTGVSTDSGISTSGDNLHISMC